MSTGYKIAVAVGLASLVTAGVALAGWGGAGYGRSTGPAPGMEAGSPMGAQNQNPWMGRGPWGGGPGPQVARPQAGPAGRGWGVGPGVNNPPTAGANYGFCPRCGAPCPRGWAAPGAGFGYGPGAGRLPRFGRAVGPGMGPQGDQWAPQQGQGFGFGRRNMARRLGPMNDGWGRGFGPGRGGEGLQPQNPAPWGGRGGWRQQPDGAGEPGPQVAPPGQAPQGPDQGAWGPPARGAWRGRMGRGMRPWGGPGAAPADKPPVAPGPEGAEQPKPQ